MFQPAKFWAITVLLMLTASYDCSAIDQERRSFTDMLRDENCQLDSALLSLAPIAMDAIPH